MAYSIASGVRSIVRHVFTVFLFSLTPLLPAGCATVEDAQAARAEAESSREKLAANIQILNSALASSLAGLPDSDPAKAAVLGSLASSRTTHDVLTAAMAEVEDALLRVRSASDDTLWGSVANAVPGPWRAPLLLGGAGIALFLRARRLKEGVQSIARGLEIAKREDDSFKALFDRHANTFRAVQSPTARKIVDDVQGGSPLPAVSRTATPSLLTLGTAMPGSGKSRKVASKN